MDYNIEQYVVIDGKEVKVELTEFDRAQFAKELDEEFPHSSTNQVD